MQTSLKASILYTRVNSVIGILFIGSCALWAGITMTEAAWGKNPVANALAKVIEEETVLK